MVPLHFLYVLLYYIVTVYAGPINNSVFPDIATCGTATANRIYGGTLATLGEFPWSALLETSESEFICGGSLINKRYILTAAHCFGHKEIVSIRLGEFNVSAPIDCDQSFPGQVTGKSCIDEPVDIPVESVTLHENYKHHGPGNITNDIALVRLSKEVNYTKYIKPVCMPIEEENKSYVGDNAVVAGWGQTETGRDSPVKLKVQIPIKENDMCYLDLDDGQLCAGGDKGKDSCVGDSGGPLMVDKNNNIQSNWYLIGIVSFGPVRCGTEKVPSVYTRVTNYIDWIVKNLKP